MSGLYCMALTVPPLWMLLLQDSVTTTDAFGDVTGLTFRYFQQC